MEETQMFLEQVLQKIRARVIQLNTSLALGEKDVEDMHEYYWDNYTEMDEYGYENFDNQQALLTQINANTELLKERSRMRRMLQSPYFGRVDFLYDGDDEPETFYIGISNFAEAKGKIPLIYDWRAPVSGLFYDYDSGPASYMAPGGEQTGEITSKWQYKIRRGKLVYAFESDVKIDDEILRQELGSRGDTKLKNIIRTIQKEQNAIIRNTSDRIMVIQGVAGSGKTSVALHRIAYLLYHDREHLKSSNVLILSPNGVFSDYISHILPELGEENIREMSFDTFAYHELKEYINDCEDRYDLLEQQLRGKNSGDSYHKKQSRSFMEAMRGYCFGLEDDLMEFAPLKIRHWEKSAEEIQELFYFKFTEFPLLDRMDVVLEYVIDEYETLRDCTISQEDHDLLREMAMKMYRTRDIYRLYSEFLASEGYRGLKHAPLEKRFLKYEDVYPMLYMKYLLMGRGDHRQIKHLIIDEMQDYSYLQYCIIEELFKCRMTILGDKAQTMDEREQDVRKFLPHILGRDLHFIEMNKSYRNTKEIAMYAEKLLAETPSETEEEETIKVEASSATEKEESGKDTEYFERHGAAVEYQKAAGEKEVLELVAEQFLARRQYVETAALLTFTEAEARSCYQQLTEILRKRGLEEQELPEYMDRNSSRFRPGLTVTTFYLAKGLEFDEVYMLTPDRQQTPLHRQARYICATRAMHKLYDYRLTLS